MSIPRLLFRLLLGRRLPITSGTLTVPGIARPVVVHRDRSGIPYIEAEEEADAWYGVGFCQGQDRAFQLEGLRRVARGTLSEMIGPDGLASDRLSRRIGFYDSAERQMEALDPEVRRNLDSFALGVTEGSRLGCRRKAHEFTLLRAGPGAYAAADAVAVSKLQSFAIASNWDAELARLKILREDGPEALKELDPSYPSWLPVSAPPGAPACPAMDRLAEDLQTLRSVAGPGAGSNGWVLAPSRTATGRALLANDPHLAPTLPSQWYLAHVRTPSWTALGATLVGTPAFAAGHNDVAAWGATAGMVDNTDLFLEELGPDGRSVREREGFVPCKVRREVIRVKGRQDVVEEVVVTPRGPVIGPALDGDVGAVSIRATWLDPRPITGLLTSHRAGTFEEFRRAFEEWPLLSLNMIYADTSGVIGWQLVGEAPDRRKGWGSVPLPGWDPECGWEDAPVPFDQMPNEVGPAGGILATANNRPTPEGKGPFLGVDWIDGYRQARIIEALEGRHDWDLAGAGSLQMDQASLPWREVREVVLGTSVQGGEARRAAEMLRAWDGVASEDSPAAAVFELFLADMSRRVVDARAPRGSAWALGRGFAHFAPYTFFVVRRVGHLIRLLREQPNGWLDGGWPHAIEAALTTAVKTLQATYGEDSDAWAWGRVRPLTLRHPVGQRRFLGKVFNRGPFPWGGDANTVSQAAVPPLTPTANPLAIASLRMLVDVGNWEEARFALPGGQSGNPVSPHYDDLLPLWRQGDGVPIAWSRDNVRRATTSTLQLLPDASS